MSGTPPDPGVCPRCGTPTPATRLPGLAGVCTGCLADSLCDIEAPPAGAWLPGPPPTLPRRVGDYELLSELARGGMGVVYLARQVSLDRRVAVKLLLPGFVASPARLARFRSEATLAARLRHPNIVAIHDVGEHEGAPFFSMDYVEGRDLGRLVRDQGVGARQAAGLVRGVARAIQYAHERGVLHRDLKPSNVLVTPEGEPWVTDFGLAKPLDPESDLTLSGEILGSPSFMSPEQASGRKRQIDVRSDVYGLGGLLYYTLTGRPPFVGDSVSDTLRRVVAGDLVPPSVLRPGIPLELGIVAMRCLARDPRHRYASAGEVAEDLDRFLRGVPILARAPHRGERLWRWARREPTLAALLGTALLLGVVVVGGALLLASQREFARQNDAERRASSEMHRYVADVSNASRSIAEGKTHDALRMLDGLRPAPGDADPRGFEWHWLRSRTSDASGAPWWEGKEPIGALAWSPDGRRLAVVCPRSVRIMSRGGRRVFAEHPLGGPVSLRSAVFDREGRFLYIADSQGLRRMELTVGRTDTLVAEPLDGIVASPDGQWLAVRTSAVHGRRESRDVLIVDPDDGDIRAQLEGVGGPAMVWTQTAGFRGLAADGRIWGWDENAGKRVLAESNHDVPLAAALDAEGTMCATLSADGLLRTREVGTGRVISERRGKPQRDVQLAFSPDGRTLSVVGGADERVWVWSTADWTVAHRWTAHTDLVTSAVFHKDGRTLVTAGNDGTVRAWDLAEEPFERRWAHACANLPEGSARFSQDGRWIAGVRRNDSGEETALWPVADPDARPIAVPGRPVSFSPDGKFLLQWEKGGMLRLWDITNGTECVSFALNPRPTESPDQLSPDGRYFVCLDWQHQVHLYHAATTEELPGPVAHVLRVVVSPDSEWVGYTTPETVGVFRIATGEPNGFIFKGATDLAFSPDARYLAAGQGGGRIRIYDIAEHRIVEDLPAHTAPVTAVMFAPDGRTLASAGEDSSVRWWHVPAWRELVHVPLPAPVSQLQYSRDGGSLLLGMPSEYRMLSAGATAAPPAARLPKGFWIDPVNIGQRLGKRATVTTTMATKPAH